MIYSLKYFIQRNASLKISQKAEFPLGGSVMGDFNKRLLFKNHRLLAFLLFSGDFMGDKVVMKGIPD